MTEHDLATTGRGLSTADLASAGQEPESAETGRTVGDGRENLHDEDLDVRDGTDGREDVRDETHDGREDVRDETDDGRENTRADDGDESYGDARDEVRDNMRDDLSDEVRGGVREDVREDAAPQLFPEEQVAGYRERWGGVQTGFVDDPHQAVRDADELVATVISALATSFAEHKSELESQWKQGEPATEELRVALRRYRAFFDQLLPH